MAPRKKKEAKYEKVLRKTYYTPREIASFGGIQGLKKAVKRKGTKVKTKQVVNWLSTQDTYTLHKPVRHHFARSRVIVGGIDAQWQADLVDVSQLATKNQGVKYLLTCIDIFSKYAWVKPLTVKTGKALVIAFKDILKSNRKPVVLQTDQGKEFINTPFQQFLKSESIDYFTTYNEDIKASVVERFNRTLKTKMWKYFTSQQTNVFVDVLADLVWSYNHSYHRSIKMQPAEVNQQNQEEVWNNLYGDIPTTYTAPKFKVNDCVRISKLRKTFKKGYLPNWSEEMFTIEKVIRTTPIRYIIRDEMNTTLKGSFYEQELQRVKRVNRVYRIETILAERQKKNRSQVLVKWAGYPSSFNSWINRSDLRKYKG